MTFKHPQVFSQKVHRWLTVALLVRGCDIQNAKEEVHELWDEPPRQRHEVQEEAAHEQAFHHVLEGQHWALQRNPRGTVVDACYVPASRVKPCPGRSGTV